MPSLIVFLLLHLFGPLPGAVQEKLRGGLNPWGQPAETSATVTPPPECLRGGLDPWGLCGD